MGAAEKPDASSLPLKGIETPTGERRLFFSRPLAFQSLSGLSLCCYFGTLPSSANLSTFQSLSGLSLCCYKRWRRTSNAFYFVSIPFRAVAVLL